MSHPTKSRIGLALLALSAAIALGACRHENPAELLRSARDYQVKGDHHAAVIQLKNALQLQTNNGEARLLLAQSALVLGDAIGAEKEFRKALEFGQPEAVVVPRLAAALLESGQFDKLIREFAGRKLGDPKAEAELRARVGDAQLRARNPQEAARFFSEALAADPSNLTALMGRVRLTAIEGRLEDALQASAQLVAANPESVDALRLLGSIGILLGDRAGARAALERAIALAPATPYPRFELIVLLISENRFDAAAEQVAAARAARIGDLRLQYFDAVIALGRRDLARARDHALQVLKRAPEHVPTLVVLAAVELHEKQFAQAEGHLQRAVSLAPGHVGARALLAKTYLGSRQPARAVEALRPLMESDLQNNGAVLMLAGEAYLANGDLRKAVVYFDAASEAKDQQALARTRIGQIALLSGDLEEGVRELESVSAVEGAPIQAELALLGAYIRQGQTSKALDAAQALVIKRPDDPMVHHTRGTVLLGTQATAAARTAFSKALELNPTYMPAVGSLAQLDLAEGKTADARARFDAVLAREPRNELALLGLAEVMARSKAPGSEIAAVLKRAVAAEPQSVTARVALVDLHLRERDARAALAVAQQAPAEVAKDPRVLDALGRAQWASGEPNQAIETFNLVAAAEPRSVTPLLRLASVHMSRKDNEKAAEALLRAQKIAPADANISRELVRINAAMGRNNEALKEARALQAAAPRSPAGFLLEGDVHAAAKQWAAAERAYRDGLKAAPAAETLAVKVHAVLVAGGRTADAEAFARKWVADHPEAAAFRSYLGERALRARDPKTAAAHYEAVVTRQPDNVAALNNLAWSLGRLGDARALGYAERAFSLAPDNPSVLDTIGVLLTASGDPARGSVQLARAVALAPDRHDVRLNYAKALIKAGRAEDARKELVALQAVTQDFAGKSEVAELLNK